MNFATLRSLFRKKSSCSEPSSPPKQRSNTQSLPDDQSCIIDLDTDILVLIFDLIQATSPKTLQALSLVNKTFYHLTSHARLRSLELDLSPPELQASHDRLKRAERSDLLSAIATLNVTDHGSRPYHGSSNDNPFALTAVNYRNFLQSMASLMPLMTGLKSLRWNGSPYNHHAIPDCMLEALRSCPKVRLHAYADTAPRRHDNTTTRDECNLIKLRGIANLSNFRVDCTYTTADGCLEITQPLKQILLTAPALRSLTLNISMPSGGCVIYSPPQKYCGMGFVGDEKIPPLEELILIDYPWGEHTDKSASDPDTYYCHQQGYPGNRHEIEQWTEDFDWSRLRRLETSYVDFALKAMPKLVSLKSVKFTGYYHTEDIIRFYQECPGILESIGLKTLEGSTLDGILRHGSKLHTLHIHTTESESWPDTAMKDTSLVAIRESCPHIEELFIDLNRSGGDWPWSTLDILAKFPNLRDLTIAFPLTTDWDSDPIKPYVTFSSVRIIFRHLLESSPKLRSLRVLSGCPAPWAGGYPAHGAFWPFENSTEFVCTVSERDDEAARGIFEVVCPKIPCEDVDPETGGKGKHRKGGIRDTKKEKYAIEQEEMSRARRRREIDKATRLATLGPAPRTRWQDLFE